jgi:hypothetical protein
MKTKDNFDRFIEKELKNSSIRYDSEKFRNQVLYNLPQSRIKSPYRSIIIYLSGILSCIIFSLSIDIKIVKELLIDIYLFIYHSTYPSADSIIFISFVVFVIYIIPKLEFRYGIS